MHPRPVVFQLLNELSRMQSSVSEHQERSQRLQQEMGRKLQEKEQAIKAQREQVSSVSHTHAAATAHCDYVERGSEAEGQPLFRISCICYMGSDCVVLRHDDTVRLTGKKSATHSHKVPFKVKAIKISVLTTSSNYRCSFILLVPEFSGAANTL